MPDATATLPLTIATPLGDDVFTVVRLQGREGISQLFEFHVEMTAPNNQAIAFDKLLGQKMSIRIETADGVRHFHGVCSMFAQGERELEETTYRAEIVPELWLLSRRVRSRIFQQQSVQDILKIVFAGMEISWQLQGQFHPRDFCVQYRESDLQFASRLMEEEGIFYFFAHTESGHKLILANSPLAHPMVSDPSTIAFDKSDTAPGFHEITRWEKVQELRSSKCVLWDHCFELPHKHLEAEKKIIDKVQVGKSAHAIRIGANESLELFDWPGGYAERYDGIDRGGAERASELQKIFEDNQRTAEIRIQEEAAAGLMIHGESGCRQLSAGHKFTLSGHHDGDGVYVVTSVTHAAHGGSEEEFSYHNGFTCIPLALPFRPRRVTPKPAVQGAQTAVVVGPANEEIFTDKYGRVKVQFHWDRDGKNDVNSSCWLRVATSWAGKQWGAISLPRVGQEVVVDFLEGDPDQPIVVGSVFNAEMMPPYRLPDDRSVSGIKTRSTPGGGLSNFNELRFEDKKDKEYVYFHAERDFHRVVEHDDSLIVTNNRSIVIQQGDEVTRIKIGKSEREAGESIELKVGDNSIKIDRTGIAIKGLVLKLESDLQTSIESAVVILNGKAVTQIN